MSDVKLHKPAYVAELLGVEHRTVIRLIRKKRGPRIHAIKIGRVWRIPDDELQRILRDGL